MKRGNAPPIHTQSTQDLSPPDKIKPNSTYYSKFCSYSFLVITLLIFIIIIIIFYVWNSNNNPTHSAAVTAYTDAYLRIHNWLRQQQQHYMIFDNNQTTIATSLRSYTNTTTSYKTGIFNKHTHPLSQNNPSMIDTMLKDNHNPDDLKLVDMIRRVLHRSEHTLDWITSSEDKVDTVIRWDLISNSEVHILNKLVTYLKVIAKVNINDNKGSYHHIIDLARRGHQCTPIQALQQAQISRFISMDICSEIEWYKVAQLAWPEAINFVDIGANKGYLGSLFISLWGGGDIGISPIEVYNIAKRLNVWSTSRNQGGYCQDGYNYGIPLTCPSTGVRYSSDTKDGGDGSRDGGDGSRDGGDGSVDNKIDFDVNRDTQTGQCKVANSDIRITSIDGSSYLAQTLNNIIHNEIPINKHNIELVNGELWQYLNYAVSDEVGVAKFTKQDKDHNPGFEGGGMVTKFQPTIGKRSSWIEEVNMTTVDHFLTTRRSKLNKKSENIRIDILKIDTEGDDNKVLNGASKAITKDLVGMFTFEGGKGVIFSKSMIEGYDNLGYSCYSTSRAGLFKWNAGCMLDKFMGSFRAKDKGNIFCVSRVKAPMVALAYDILSFPLLIESYNISSSRSRGSRGSSSSSSRSDRSGDGEEDGSGSDSSDEKKKFKKLKKRKERDDMGGNRAIDINRRYRGKDKKKQYKKSWKYEGSLHEEEEEEKEEEKKKDHGEEKEDRVEGVVEDDGVVMSRDRLIQLLTTNITYITPEMLVPIYLNIKPFCKPWPMCARVEVEEDYMSREKRRNGDGYWDN